MNIAGFIGFIIAIYFLIFINVETWLRVRRIDKALNERKEDKE